MLAYASSAQAKCWEDYVLLQLWQRPLRDSELHFLSQTDHLASEELIVSSAVQMLAHRLLAEEHLRVMLLVFALRRRNCHFDSVFRSSCPWAVRTVDKCALCGFGLFMRLKAVYVLPLETVCGSVDRSLEIWQRVGSRLLVKFQPMK